MYRKVLKWCGGKQVLPNVFLLNEEKSEQQILLNVDSHAWGTAEVAMEVLYRRK